METSKIITNESRRQGLINRHYKEMVDPLSLKQYVPIMFKKYVEMPAIIRKVTKNKDILFHAACLEYLTTGESKHLDGLQKHNLNTAVSGGVIGE